MTIIAHVRMCELPKKCSANTVKPVKLDTLKSRTPLELGRLCRERSDFHTCVQTLKSWTLDYVGHLGWNHKVSNSQCGFVICVPMETGTYVITKGIILIRVIYNITYHARPLQM